MSVIICDISAFYLLRIPPCVRAFIPVKPDLSTRRGRLALKGFSSYLGYLDLPVHIISPTSEQRPSPMKAMRFHRLPNDMLFGQVRELSESVAVTSPELTLLLMASWLDEVQLTMAMYECCGTFSVFEPNQEHRLILQDFIDRGEDMSFQGWHPSLDTRGRLTRLWQRPPLTNPDRLLAYAAGLDGYRGVARFRTAARSVLGSAASPFEVQAVMSLGNPRGSGGEGFGPLLVNEPIHFDASSRILASKQRCTADILFPGTDDHGPFALECQGKAYHGEEGLAQPDADRLLALRNMGIDCYLLTSRQLYDTQRYHELVKLIARKLGHPYRAKTERQLHIERDFRRSLFIDWRTLGAVTPGPRRPTRS